MFGGKMGMFESWKKKHNDEIARNQGEAVAKEPEPVSMASDGVILNPNSPLEEQKKQVQAAHPLEDDWRDRQAA